MTNPDRQMADWMSNVNRQLHALATAPQAPLTATVLDQQAEILANQAEIDAAVERLQETTTVITFTPSTDTDTSASSGWQDWLDIGDVTIPEWATAVAVTFSMSIVDVSGDPTLLAFRLKIGSEVLEPLAQAIATGWQTHSWGATTDSLPSGTQSVVVQSGDTGQTATAFAPGNPTTVVAAFFTFL